MMGAGIGVWLYQEVGGLRVELDKTHVFPKYRFGVEKIISRRIGSAKANTYVAGYSKLESVWLYHNNEKKIYHNVTVPFTNFEQRLIRSTTSCDEFVKNAAATIELPQPRIDGAIRENGIVIWTMNRIEDMRSSWTATCTSDFPFMLNIDRKTVTFALPMPGKFSFEVDIL